jgi:hypothetical protein
VEKAARGDTDTVRAALDLFVDALVRGGDGKHGRAPAGCVRAYCGAL